MTREILFGLAGPLVVAGGSWMLVERVYRLHPERLTAAMTAGFAGKMVFFAAYFVIALKLLMLQPVPFVATFTTAFIGLYLIEALCLRRLFARPR